MHVYMYMHTNGTHNHMSGLTIVALTHNSFTSHNMTHIHNRAYIIK